MSHLQPSEPSAWVVRFAGLVPRRGTVLDLACGSGRHARFLAARGCRVTAVDRDREALAGLGRVPGVTTLQADLESAPWPFAGRCFDAVVVVSYLHRPLFPFIRQALAGGGVLVYETFMRGNEALGRPSSPDFLLEPGELLHAFADLSPVAFEQGRVASPRQAVVQRLCAVNGNAPASIRLEGEEPPAVDTPCRPE